MRRKKIFSITVIIILLMAGAVFFRLRQSSSAELQRKSITEVQVEHPQRTKIVDRIIVNGDLTPFQQATLYPKVSGTLEQMYVQIGDNAPAGKLLALIDTVELYQTVLQTEASYLNAKLNYQRALTLIGQHLIAQQDVDNAEVALKTADANYTTALARLSYARITAPFHGVITKRFLDAGSVVTQNMTPLFTLMDIDHIKIMVNVPEREVPKLTHVSRADVTLDALPGKKFSGILRRISQAIDLNTRTMEIEVDIDNSSHEMKPGMFATTTLIAGERQDVITLPTQAILSDQTGSYVFCAVGGKAQRVNVTNGVEQDNRIEIVKGLKGDEDVIVLGQSQLRQDADIRIQK